MLIVVKYKYIFNKYFLYCSVYLDIVTPEKEKIKEN